MTTENAYILKILSGPHLGAEVLLDRDRYTLGQGDECEIILNDSDVADMHLTLCVADGRLSLTALGGSFLVDGRELDGTDAEVGFYQVVTIGNTRFAVGPEDEKWPDLTLPETVSRTGAGVTLEPEGDQAGFPDEDQAAFPDDDPADFSDGDQEGFPDKDPKEEPAGPKTGSNTGSHRSKWILAGVCVCIVVIVVSAVTLQSGAVPSPENPSVITPDTPLEKLERSLREMGLDHIRAETGETGQILVAGYVRDQGEKQKLADELGRLAKDGTIAEPETRVRVSSAIVGACKDLLRASGLAVAVESRGPGELVFSGPAEEKPAWEAVKAMMRQDIPGIRSMTFRVADGPGAVPQEPEGYSPPDLAPVKTTGAGDREFELTLRSVNLGSIRYLTLADGQKYFEGSVLENGYIIKSITPERIVVSGFNRQKTFLLGGSP